jgi:hypothetical protein
VSLIVPSIFSVVYQKLWWWPKTTWINYTLHVTPIVKYRLTPHYVNKHNSNITSFFSYINNTVIKLPIYCNSHMRIVELIINIIPKWFHAFIKMEGILIEAKLLSLHWFLISFLVFGRVRRFLFLCFVFLFFFLSFFIVVFFLNTNQQAKTMSKTDPQ